MKYERNDPCSRPHAHDAVRGVGTLVSELLHGLRNPVAAFKTSLELQLAGSVSAEDLPQLHRVMRNELTKLTDLLGRCSELTRLEQLALIPQDLVKLLTDRTDSRRADFTSQGVTAHVDVPSEEITVDADADLLGTAIDALISNALEAFETNVQGTREVTIRLRRRDQSGAVISIKDNGRGIAKFALPNVFRLFYSTKKGQSGVGLTMARQVALAHGGTVQLTSEVGVGTEALMELQ